MRGGSYSKSQGVSEKSFDQTARLQWRSSRLEAGIDCSMATCASLRRLDEGSHFQQARIGHHAEVLSALKTGGHVFRHRRILREADIE